MGTNWKRIWTLDDPASSGARLILGPAIDALRNRGKEVRVFMLDRRDPTMADRARRDLLQFHPDWILLANHPSSLFLQSFGIQKVPCPVLVWLFDDPALMGDESFVDEEIVLVSDPRFETGARARGARTVFFFPVAAPDMVIAECRQEFCAPLLYVGSIRVNRETRAGIEPAMLQYLDEIIHRKVENPRREFEELLQTHPLSDRQQVRLTGPLRYFLYTEANRLFRIRFLERCVQYGLKLYGNEQWKSLEECPGLEGCYHGRLDPFLEYPHAIRSAAISLNLRSLQGFSAPTHRDFLTPQAGGFLLSTTVNNPLVDWKKHDPGNRFHLDEFPWSPAAGSPEELVNLLESYRNHDSARQEWTQIAQKEIARRHTYSIRIRQLDEALDSTAAFR